MCIPKEDREKRKFKITNPGHVLQEFKERGKKLFQCDSVRNMLDETQRHILDDMRCVICPDRRPENNKSNYLAMFVTDAGDFAVVPLFIDDTHINILTLKDLSRDDHINWHIDQYNKIGKSRGVTPLQLSFRGNNFR
jgi:hypothetical protein